ncbi:hypothetical protein Tco_0764587 [Tanacetum coccineum]
MYRELQLKSLTTLAHTSLLVSQPWGGYAAETLQDDSSTSLFTHIPKDNGENIMKSIKEGPFQMGTVSDVITGGTEGAVQQGPVRARVLNDLSAEEKEKGMIMEGSGMQLNVKIVNNMLPEWSRFITEVKLNRGLKESNSDQLYAYLKQHEVHAIEKQNYGWKGHNVGFGKPKR